MTFLSHTTSVSEFWRFGDSLITMRLAWSLTDALPEHHMNPIGMRGIEPFLQPIQPESHSRHGILQEGSGSRSAHQLAALGTTFIFQDAG